MIQSLPATAGAPRPAVGRTSNWRGQADNLTRRLINVWGPFILFPATPGRTPLHGNRKAGSSRWEGAHSLRAVKRPPQKAVAAIPHLPNRKANHGLARGDLLLRRSPFRRHPHLRGSSKPVALQVFDLFETKSGQADRPLAARPGAGVQALRGTQVGRLSTLFPLPPINPPGSRPAVAARWKSASTDAYSLHPVSPGPLPPIRKAPNAA